LSKIARLGEEVISGCKLRLTIKWMKTTNDAVFLSMYNYFFIQFPLSDPLLALTDSIDSDWMMYHMVCRSYCDNPNPCSWCKKG
jgi:hypothetical protein